MLVMHRVGLIALVLLLAMMQMAAAQGVYPPPHYYLNQPPAVVPETRMPPVLAQPERVYPPLRRVPPVTRATPVPQNYYAVSEQFEQVKATRNVPPKWYVGLNIPVITLQERSVSETSASGHIESDIEYDTGLGVGLAAGYQWNDWLRSEIDIAYHKLNADDGQTRNFDAVGALTSSQALTGDYDLEFWRFMVNQYIDAPLPFASSVVPYLGAGAGFAFRNETDNADSEVSFAWQAMTGIAWKPAERIRLNIGYRYLDAGEFDDNGTDPGTQAHIGEAGVKFYFGN